jgi:ABC-2 type transport system ATP-binding protein
MTGTPLIEAVDLHKSFGEKKAVDGISLQIAAGEVFGLVGADGAGKTTTLRLLVGALRPDAGMVRICGFDMANQVEEGRAQLGYLSQRFSLYEDLTVLENIRFFTEVRGLTTREWLPRSLEILEFVGLVDFKDRRAGQLSGGMKQKLGLASALVHKPRVLLLDEPTTGVDPVTRQDFWQLLIRLVSVSGAVEGEGDRNIAVLLSTPYMDEASRCNRLGFMRQGRFMMEGTPGEIRAVLDGRIVELRGQPIQLLRKIAQEDQDVEDVRLFGDRLHLRVREKRARAVIGHLPARIQTSGGSLIDLRQVPPSLEDVFIALLEETP